MPGFKIRRATIRDIDVLAEHRQRMFDKTGARRTDQGDVRTDPYRGWGREMMKKRLHHCYFVLTDSGMVAASGCVWLRQVQPSRGRPASMVPYLMSIYTVPRFRRKGLASMIVKHAMAWAKRKEYGTMTPHASLTGRKVYTKLGLEAHLGNGGTPRMTEKADALRTAHLQTQSTFGSLFLRRVARGE